MNFGERLVKIRQELGFNQVQFAEKLGIQPQALVRYEKNKTKPSIDLLNKLTDLFNINLNYLITGKGEMFSNPSNTPSNTDIETICNYLSELDNLSRKKVLKYILDLQID